MLKPGRKAGTICSRPTKPQSEDFHGHLTVAGATVDVREEGVDVVESVG